jgi:hypothetical protein
MSKIEEITIDQLNELINNSEDRITKKALLVVKASFKGHEGPIKREIFERSFDN